MFKEDRKWLPYSGRRFSITNLGGVVDVNGNKIKSFIKDNNHYVTIDWIYGRSAYLVSLLVLVAFEKIKIPEHLLINVEPLFIDNDFNNLSPINIIYRYKNGPLKVEGYNEFYYIPLYNDYAISKEGMILNIKTGKFKVWSITNGGGKKNQTGGYSYTRVVTDSGESKVLFLHRALCLVFLRYTEKVLSLVVNHKDGNPSNNNLSNLEWCTYKENNEHAYANGLRLNSATPVLMKDLKTNLITKFQSFSECARYLNLSNPGLIATRLVSRNNRVFSDMLLFKLDDGSEWPIINLDTLKISRLGKGGDIIARNIFTGDTIIFNGTRNGEKYTGVKSGTILRHLRENSNIPIKGYNFRYLDFIGDWPVHSKRHLEIYSDYPTYPSDGVIMKDITTLEETFFTSVCKACQSLRISKQSLGILINKSIIYKNKYSFSYFKIKDAYSPTTKKLVD
jgi:hypothetical protein